MKSFVSAIAALSAAACFGDGETLAEALTEPMALDLSDKVVITTGTGLRIQGIGYSSVGWERETGADEGAVRIYAVADGEETEIAIASGLTGRGTCDWTVPAADGIGTYRIYHEVAGETTLAGCIEVRQDLGAYRDAMVDLREEEVLVYDSSRDIPAIAYSSTNFTGLAGTDATSVAKVTRCRMKKIGDDPKDWTMASSAPRTLVNTVGEGVRNTAVRQGVLKYTYTITTGGTDVQTFERILDFSAFGSPGFAVFFK